MNVQKPWMTPNDKGWIAVDLDGTLAFYDDTWLAWNKFGAPIMPMVRRVQQWLSSGIEVRIMTARVFPFVHGVGMAGPSMFTRSRKCLVTDEPFSIHDMIGAIQLYTQEHVGYKLPCTCAKDYKMLEQWDDRAIQVIPNTGVTIADEWAATKSALAGKAHG